MLQEKLYVPLGNGFHFILIVVNTLTKVITVYDSFNKDEHNQHAGTFTQTVTLLNHLEYLANKGSFNVKYDWNAALRAIPGVPQQNDGSSCGFFVLMFLELRARDLPFEYLELILSDKPRRLPLMFYRRRLVYNMIRGRPYTFEPSHASDYNE